MVRKLRILMLMFLLLMCYSKTVVPSGNNKTEEEQTKQALNFMEYRRCETTMNLFTNQLGYDESTNNWLNINPIGAFGEYQFMTNTLRVLGYGHITVDKFRKNPNIFPPELQRKVLNDLITSNTIIMQSYIDKYQGKSIYGVKITKAGILAACHLAGPGGVQRFLNGIRNPIDINGTTVYQYLRKYQHFDLTLHLV